MMIRNFLKHLKSIAVPDAARFRTFPLGLCRGYRFLINFRHDTLLYLGLYEVEIRFFFETFARQSRCCFDIGANSGYYSLAFARCSPTGSVYALEGDPKACDLLRATIDQNPRIKSRVQVLENWIEKTTDLDQRQVSLDYLIFERGLPPPDLLKVDIEGMEYNFLRGAEEVVKRYLPRLIIETHDAEIERHCVFFLKERGYRVLIINQRTWLPEHRPLAHNRWICAEPVLRP